MHNVREDYEQEWRNISRFAQPARSRFLGTKADKGEKRRFWNNRLKDSHGIEAFRTLANGLTSGLSSPSRPWYALRLPDEDLNEQPGVREYLADVERRMYAFLASTNFYGSVKAGYAELGLFGTEACVMVEHPAAGAVCHALTAGEYWIALSDAMTPDTLLRESWMSARQMVQSFGSEVPETVRKAAEKDSERSIRVWNLIEPNPTFDKTRLGSKPWRSIYWCDEGHSDDLLAVQGYAEQPFWAPRWDVVGGDTYGVSPGMEALPALRELQVQAARRNEAIDFMVKPEKAVPPGLRLTGQPGRVVSANGVTQDQVVIPYQMPYQAVDAVGQEMDKCKSQIDSLSFADLFNAITNMRGIQPRNMEEIASRNEEKLTQLGPVIERVSNEKLEIVIDRTFGIMQRGGLLPPVPEALANQRIDVEFVSILQQMQRAVGVGQIERGASFAGNTAGVAPEVLDNFNFDEMAREYADRIGLPANAVRSMKQVEEIRGKRAQQQQAQQAAEMADPMKKGVEAAALLAQTDLGGAPMLDQLMGA